MLTICTGCNLNENNSSLLLKDMVRNFIIEETNTHQDPDVTQLDDTKLNDLHGRKVKDTHRQGGMWWGRFLLACTALSASRWRRILPQPLTGQPSAGRAGTAWLSVSPDQQRKKEKWHRQFKSQLDFLRRNKKTKTFQIWNSYVDKTQSK